MQLRLLPSAHQIRWVFVVTILAILPMASDLASDEAVAHTCHPASIETFSPSLVRSSLNCRQVEWTPEYVNALQPFFESPALQFASR